MSTAGAHRVLTGPNPFGVDPRHDLLHDVQRETRHWGETMYFHAWNPDAGVGAFLHVGRWPQDLDLWWAQTIALLPDGELLVDRSWGRATDDRGPATGNLRITCKEPLARWRLSFDGAAEATTLACMAQGPVGAGAATALRFEIELEAAAPVWDMHAAFGMEGVSWAAHHHTQGLRSSGTLTAGGREWRMEGVAHRDHSSGPRQLRDFGGLHFFVLVFPRTGRVVNGVVSWARDGTVGPRVYTTQQDGRCEIGPELQVTGLADLATHEPRQLEVRIVREDATPEVLDAEWLHGYTLSLLERNENINGAAWGFEDDPLIITQATVRVTAADGEVGYGVIERDYRPSMLPSPEPR
ncbi:MAG: hypothetical protein JWO02_2192 [Solirubrobacterales bacterium]|nr:hypothetical protein [Solirubrobacterales bacterium]